MRVKANMVFQVDDESGNTTDRCTADVYINCLKDEDFDLVKKGLSELCQGMENIINNV